ncbi:MAG: hypothetical protein IPL41_10780 [Micropruina sp.]|nr:hypothetical protein [Micropruina sp.]
MDEPTRSWLPARAGRWALAAGAALLLLTVGLGVIGGRLGPPLPAATIAAPTPGPASVLPSPPVAAVVVDTLTRELTVEPYLSGRMPPRPFAFDAPTSVKGLFSDVVFGGVTSDPDWDQDENLPATIVVGELEPAAVIEGDLGGTARGVVAEFSRRSFSTLDGLVVAGVRSDDPFAIGSYPAQWAHAEVTGRLTSGATERVAISLLLVSLPNARTFAFVGVKPDRPTATPHFAAIDAAAASIVPAS